MSKAETRKGRKPLTNPKRMGKADIDADLWTKAYDYVFSIDGNRLVELGTARFEETVLQVAAHAQVIRNMTNITHEREMGHGEQP